MPACKRLETLLLAGLLGVPATAVAQAIPVTLEQTDQGWQLLRDGTPYFIRGAGGARPGEGASSLAALAAAGANSVRTWGEDATLEYLDAAHANGLSVAVGLWLGHERHGFDYRDPAQIAGQRARIRDKVLRLKDHPAVLLWGVGNEMEGFADGDDPAIWAEVNHLAAMVKRLDPLHPTMTVTAYAHGERIDYVHRKSPAIDIHGINAYGGGSDKLLSLLREGRGSKPFVLTEFGPVGPWEAEQTSWGAPVEATSTDKARSYRASHDATVVAAGAMSLGSYAFLWGDKMEATHTWFGMFLDDGAATAAVDVMTEIWSGSAPANLAPKVSSLTVDGDQQRQPGARIAVSVLASDPEGQPLRARWALKPESGERVTGGDFRRTLPDIAGAVVEAGVDAAVIKLPQAPGAYRVFYTVYDDDGKAATANLPLRVIGEPKTSLPIEVYSNHFEDMPWAPSGWMGYTEALTLDGSNGDNPRSGDAAINIRYTGTFGWAGIAWQNPPNNWGDQAGGYDLTGATELELWARGAWGGEAVSFGVGFNEPPKPHADSGQVKLDNIVLTHEWRRYAIPLRGVDLSSIKTGFVVTLEGRQSPVTIYLDDIRFK